MEIGPPAVTTPRATPRHFGPPTRPLFGWLHEPAVPARGGLGLVVCNPFGHDLSAAHRSLRHLAEAGAAAGTPVLRFDYDGTGDAAGTALDPDRPEAWLASVHHAADTLRTAASVERVCVFGVGLGASLASLVAGERTDVAGLAVLAPVVSGRAWLRQMRVLQNMTGFTPGPEGWTPPDGAQEVLGHWVPADAAAWLRGLDLTALDRAPAPHVLLLERADLPDEPRLGAHFESLGSTVDRRRVAGYTEMLLDPHETVVPTGIIETVCGWLVERADESPGTRPARGTSPDPAPDRPPGAPVAPGVTEAPVYLDEGRGLFGILAQPEGARPSRAVILVNSGAIPRMGPSRQYVTLSRRWAARGVSVLRFDIAGLGDSPARPGHPDNVVYPPDAIDDLRAAVRWLRETAGVERIHAAGVCSGAYHSLRASVEGVPIDGVVGVNPLVYHWRPDLSLDYPSYQVLEASARYRRSVFQWQKWKKLLMGKVAVRDVPPVLFKRASLHARRLTRNAARSVGLPFREDLGAELRALADRGVDLHLVFASGHPGEDLLRVEAGSALGRLQAKGLLAVWHVHGANHSFTPAWTQEALAEVFDRVLGME